MNQRFIYRVMARMRSATQHCIDVFIIFIFSPQRGNAFGVAFNFSSFEVLHGYLLKQTWLQCGTKHQR
jgi:hypothetical protein